MNARLMERGRMVVMMDLALHERVMREDIVPEESIAAVLKKVRRVRC
jgi:hypothetical protein